MDWGHSRSPHQYGLLSVVNPALCGEVGGLGTVEPVVEPSVVAVGKRHHELACHLGDLGQANSTHNIKRPQTRKVSVIKLVFLGFF